MKRLIVLAVALLLVGCARPDAEGAAARGVILVSLDALRADRLGAYGYEKDTSPFLDELAARGVLFERFAVHYPATLVSNLSLFTGLYPEEHGVYPPSGVLAAEIETLPEVFRRNGFRTAGHTEGGFMAGGYGFARGFELFTDTAYASEQDVERTLGRGLDFLRRLTDGERFFLFLHTFVTHDPYDPPLEYAELLDVRPLPEGAPPPTGPTLREFNAGEVELPPETIGAFSDRYDASIRYADDALRRFWSEIEAMGLAEETVLVVTSDHGEEFGEHGALGHTQVYPETLFAPLIVAPGSSVARDVPRGARVSELVENVRLAPTLLELAGVAPSRWMSRPSLAAHWAGDSPSEAAAAAYAEVREARTTRSLLADVGAERFQLLVSQVPADPEGAWVSRAVTFDALGGRLDLRLQTFHRERLVRIETEEAVLAEQRVGPSWTRVQLDLPEERGLHRLTLSAESCDSPADLGVSDDARCLSFQVRDQPLYTLELYDLTEDPGAQRNVASERPEIAERLLRQLAQYRFRPLAPPGEQDVAPEVLETLRALGYVE